MTLLGCIKFKTIPRQVFLNLFRFTAHPLVVEQFGRTPSYNFLVENVKLRNWRHLFQSTMVENHYSKYLRSWIRTINRQYLSQWQTVGNGDNNNNSYNRNNNRNNNNVFMFYLVTPSKTRTIVVPWATVVNIGPPESPWQDPGPGKENFFEVFHKWRHSCGRFFTIWKT